MMDIQEKFLARLTEDLISNRLTMAEVALRVNQEQFLLQLTEDLVNNRVTLPTLPEISLRVKKVVENERSTVAQIARIVVTDAVLCIRLLRLANSALYRSRIPVKNVQEAISRVGMSQVHNVVNALVMEQIYLTASLKALRPHLTRLWTHSTRVAAISMVLAHRYTKLSPDQAMLGGLIHDVGILPILSRAEGYPSLFNNPEALSAVIADLHGDVGHTILTSWNFPVEFSIAAAEHDDLTRNSGPEKDLADIIQVANLLSYVGTNHRHMAVDWTTVPAFAKLGLTPVMAIAVLKEAEMEIRETQAILEN
ncbi:HDOD domain-containing protein [Gammaproteobacteria bacterium]